MVPKPDPVTDPEIRFCKLLINWLNDKEKFSEEQLIEKLQYIFGNSGPGGTTRILQEMRLQLPADCDHSIKYRFTASGPELDVDSLRELIRKLKTRYRRHSGKQAKSGSRTNTEEKRQCIDA